MASNMDFEELKQRVRAILQEIRETNAQREALKKQRTAQLERLKKLRSEYKDGSEALCLWARTESLLMAYGSKDVADWKSLGIVITGFKRHGKDTVCEILRDIYGLSFESSSEHAARKFIFDQMKGEHGYQTIEECFEDRYNHREEWFNRIVAYNTPDLARLGRELLTTYDIYCGLRNIDELNALKREGLVSLVIWVDSSKRLPPEDKNSMTITPDDCDLIINNNRSLDDLKNLLKQGLFYV